MEKDGMALLGRPARGVRATAGALAAALVLLAGCAGPGAGGGTGGGAAYGAVGGVGGVGGGTVGTAGGTAAGAAGADNERGSGTAAAAGSPWVDATVPGGAVPADAVTIKVIAFNDFHGHLETPPGAVPVRDPRTGGLLRVPAGGIASLATLVATLKAENPNNVVVAAGDLIGATPFVSAQFSDEPTIELLGRIGLEVSSVGNHEFDKGRNELLRMVGGGCRPRSADGRIGRVGVDTCALDGRFDGARFRYLAANVVDADSGAPLLPATWIKSFGAASIGFVGLTLRDTPTVVSPAGVRGLRFTDEVDTINRLVPELLARQVSSVVVLIHQGGRTAARFVGDPSCPGLTGDILAIADRLHPAVSLVVTGHTHREYVCARGGRLITQAGAEGRMLTDIELTVSPAQRRVVAQRARTRVVVAGPPLAEADRPAPSLPPALPLVVADRDIAQRLARYSELAAPARDVVIGRIRSTIHRRPSAAGETEIGNLVADAYLQATPDETDRGLPRIALTNPGGLRTELPFDLASDGEVTRGMLFSVLPFNNQLVAMDLTGDQLRRLLEQQWERPQPAGGRVLQVSRGFSYRWNAQAPAGAEPGQGRRVVPGSMTIDGVPVEPQRVYRVIVNDFMANGGDNFGVFLEGRNRQVGERDIDIVQSLLQAQSPVAPPPLGRILVQ